MQEWQEWQGSQEWQVEQAGSSMVRSRPGSGLVLLMCSAVLASSAGLVGEVEADGGNELQVCDDEVAAGVFQSECGSQCGGTGNSSVRHK